MFRRLLAPLGTIGLLVLAVQALTWVTGPSWDAARSGTASLDEMIGALAAFGAWVLVGWVSLVLATTALTALPGVAGRASSRVAATITPIAARRAARLALGVAVAAGPVALSAGPAFASPISSARTDVAAAQLFADGDLPLIERPTRPDQTPQPAEPLSVQSLLDAEASATPAGQGESVREPRAEPTGAEPTGAEPTGAEPTGAEPTSPGQSSDTPADSGTGTSTGEADSNAPGVTPSRPDSTQDTASGAEAPQTVQVRPGDSLWEIAARHLGPAASTAQIAAEWPRWYRANRATIGDDPDLIVPGMTLVAPTR